MGDSRRAVLGAVPAVQYQRFLGLFECVEVQSLDAAGAKSTDEVIQGVNLRLHVGFSAPAER